MLGLGLKAKVFGLEGFDLDLVWPYKANTVIDFKVIISFNLSLSYS